MARGRCGEWHTLVARAQSLLLRLSQLVIQLAFSDLLREPSLQHQKGRDPLVYSSQVAENCSLVVSKYLKSGWKNTDLAFKMSKNNHFGANCVREGIVFVCHL